MATDMKLLFEFKVSSNLLSNVVFQISTSGYPPVVWVGSCVTYIVGVLSPNIADRYLIQKTIGDGYRIWHQCER